MLLHEWSYPTEQRPQLQTSDLGEISYEKEPTENVTTWVYDEGNYTPIAKLINGERYSIVSDYIGRPVQCFNDHGELIWETDYDIYGRLKDLKGRDKGTDIWGRPVWGEVDKSFIPFRQMGQYEDEELGGLYYNRFRYYDSGSGVYISQYPMKRDTKINMDLHQSECRLLCSEHLCQNYLMLFVKPLLIYWQRHLLFQL